MQLLNVLHEHKIHLRSLFATATVPVPNRDRVGPKPRRWRFVPMLQIVLINAQDSAPLDCALVNVQIKMAMITLSGYPSSGKTRRAIELEKILGQQQTLPIVIINDESLGLQKSVYDNSKTEKPARATLFASVTRQLSPNRIVIIDALNYIKVSAALEFC